MDRKKVFNFIIVITMSLLLSGNIYALSMEQNFETKQHIVTYQQLAQNDTVPRNTIVSANNNNEAESPTCEGILSEELLDYINEILNYIKIFVPIYLLLLGTVDFSKAVIAGDERTIKTSQSNFVKRTIAAAAIFLFPPLLNVILRAAGFVQGTCGIG